jgi:hypothetical protein
MTTLPTSVPSRMVGTCSICSAVGSPAAAGAHLRLRQAAQRRQSQPTMQVTNTTRPVTRQLLHHRLRAPFHDGTREKLRRTKASAEANTAEKTAVRVRQAP